MKSHAGPSGSADQRSMKAAVVSRNIPEFSLPFVA